MAQDGTVEPGLIPDEGLESRPAQQNEPSSGRPPSRRELVASKRAQSRRNRPFVITGILLFIAILAIPVYGYVREFVLPPREVAVQVNDATYTRGYVVDFVRFHQRLALENGNPFDISDQMLTAIQTISENEIAFQKAPLLGVTVSEEEVQGAIRETMGFRGMSTSQAAEPATRADIDEAFRQLLNRTQLSEAAYTDIIRKGLFREKARRALQLDVPRLQPQKRVYQLEFRRDTDPDVERARRRLTTGDPMQQVALDLSQEAFVARTGGELGWMPEFVFDDLDAADVIFGKNELGEPKLPPNTLSEGVWNGTDAVYRYYYVDEVADARELDPEDLETLSDRALAVWLEDQRVSIDNYKLVFNSEIFVWIGQQVSAAGIDQLEIPTPAPGSQPINLGDFIQGAN